MYLCRDGLTIVFHHMHHDVMSSLSEVRLLSVSLLSLDQRFFCGLAFPCLCTTKVLPPRQHSGELFCPHLEPVASFFGRPLIEALAVQLQPNCRCQYMGGAILWFMGQAWCIRYRQNRLLNLLPSLLFCHLGSPVFNRVQKAFRDVNLDQESDCSIYDSVKHCLVSDLGQCAYVCADCRQMFMGL